MTRMKVWVMSDYCVGVFAGAKRIPAGTFVGIYAGELLRDSVSEERGLSAFTHQPSKRAPDPFT